MSAKQTIDLVPGDKVLLVGRHVRTVARVEPAGYIGMTGRPVHNVHYREGRTPEWSNANSGADTTEWTLVIEPVKDERGLPLHRLNDPESDCGGQVGKGPFATDFWCTYCGKKWNA